MMHVDTIVSSPMLNTVTTLLWDALSLVWMELLLFVLAAGLYCVFLGFPVQVSKEVREKERSPPGTPRTRSDDAQTQLTQRLRARGQARDFAGLCADLPPCGSCPVPAFNAFLEACLQCGEVAHAETEFARFAAQGAVDVVSCNTLLKARLRAGRLAAAKELFAAFPNGLQPNKVSYNELLNALVGKDRPAMWAALGDMQQAGYAPSPVTVSILLKSLGSSSEPRSVQRVLQLADAVPMDEVLFSSVIEACVRVGQLGQLSAQLERYAASGGLERLSAPTYGSLIKAFGKARDLERVWQLWAAMRAQGVLPTSVTLGCMVDALVKNGQPHEAHELVLEIEADPQTAGLLNTVVYSTLLKGFTLARLPDLVDAVYARMARRGVALNTVSFNTMIDAFAAAGRMDRCEELLADLERGRCAPDVITFSTLVKGYCMAGDLDRGFSVLRRMLASGKQRPDEILFNSLLDGCARQHRVEDALALVEDMHAHAVQPSNYTLSILVKLLGRARRLEDAFRTVEETCRRFHFRANVHVYTCLLQACVQNRQLSRALELHDTLVAEERVAPDAKLYTSLARGCLSSGSARLACVVRAAHGLPGSLAAPRGAPGLEPRVLEEAMQALSASPMAEQVAVPLLADLKALGVHVERGTYASAVQTSVKRAGCHPSKTFVSYARGRSGGRGR